MPSYDWRIDPDTLSFFNILGKGKIRKGYEKGFDVSVEGTKTKNEVIKPMSISKILSSPNNLE